MLTLENVSFEVQAEKGQKEIIRNMNLTIDDRKFVVITGPNGGGKSTLAKLIAGIEKPTAGRFILTEQILRRCPLPSGLTWNQLCISAACPV